MGGHGHGKYPPILIDPAIEKWYHMKENTQVHFKFTRRTALITGVLTIVFPAFLYWGITSQHNKFQLMGTKRGEEYRLKE